MVAEYKRSNIEGTIQDYIEAKARAGWSPAQISKDLGVKSPDIRTIRKIVKEVVSSDTSGRWSIAESESEDIRLVLDVLAGCMENHSSAIGYNNYLTKSQAEWVIKLSKAAPGANARIIATLVHLYMSRAAKGIVDNSDLDAYLAFKPWQSSDSMRLYKRTVSRGLVPEAPWWRILVEEVSKAEHLDPRFTGNADAVGEFENDIYERSNNGESLESIADVYDIHPEDVNDIIRKYEMGGTK
jgi:hypothetical protein